MDNDFDVTVDFKQVNFVQRIESNFFGDVIRASVRLKDGLKRIMAKQLKNTNRIPDEIPIDGLKNLSRLRHENIVTLYGISIDYNKREIYALLEYLYISQSLSELLHNEKHKHKVISIKNKLIWMRQCASAIAYMHEKNVIHQDLSTQNIMVYDHFRKLKLCNFSTVEQITLGKAANEESVYYKAPEVARSLEYDTKINIYSFGIIFWEVMSRKKPFYYLANAQDIITNVITGVRPSLDDIDDNKDYFLIKALIKQCWHPDSVNRPTISDVINTLGLYFKSFSDNDVNDDTEIILENEGIRKVSLRNTEIRENALGNIDINDITVQNYIKRGSYGEVYRAKWRTKDGEKTIAVKILLKLDDSKQQMIDRELLNLARLTHDNIVIYYGTCQDKDSRIHILLEYAECGSLYDFLHTDKKTNISYIGKLNWMRQCATGIAYLHEQNIVHRDLKTQNILLFENRRKLKLCDFGTVREVASKMTEERGTCLYMAPEVALGEKYDTKCDVYSFGIIFWEVMSRKVPYYELSSFHKDIVVLKKVDQGYRPSLDDIKGFENFSRTHYVQQLIEGCWNQDPRLRLTMKSVEFYLGIDPSLFGDDTIIEIVNALRTLREICDQDFIETTTQTLN